MTSFKRSTPSNFRVSNLIAISALKAQSYSAGGLPDLARICWKGRPDLPCDAIYS